MKFALLGLPRSGTAWASVWLDAIHDPLDRMMPHQIPSDRGICCTASWMVPGLVESWTCPIVLVDRPPAEVAYSIGWEEIPETALKRWKSLPYPRFSWRSLWHAPEPIWRTLKPGIPFDRARWAELARLNIQVELSNYEPDYSILTTLVKES